MKIAKLLRISSLVFVLAALGACKSSGETVEEGPSQENSSGDSGSDDSAPTIWGEPETSVLAHTQYYFAPEAEDADGDVLEFAIVNKPVWAEFDGNSGVLHGTPDEGDVGEYQDVIISVTDGDSVASLPNVSIQVTSGSGGDTGGGGDDGDDPGTSSPPTIEGEPNTTTTVGKTYTFQPEASDPDGDKLSFSIVNRPVWAEFETNTGKLSGEPGHEDVGTSNPIGISVTDGSSVAALNEFTITVEATGSTSHTLSWTPPTENEDGTPLTDLAGYRIYYGTSPGEYGETIEVSAGLTSYVIEDLSPGTYYLAMTSLNSTEMESERTPEMEVQPTS